MLHIHGCGSLLLKCGFSFEVGIQGAPASVGEKKRKKSTRFYTCICLYVSRHGKSRRTGQKALVRNMLKPNGVIVLFCFFPVFQFFKNIFVNFDMLTVHILRNCYEKME